MESIALLTIEESLQPDVMKRLQRCKTLPSMPAVAMEVLRLCRQRDFHMRDLAQIISRDPALSAKVLKVANSAFYGVAREITTVNQAVMWLGVQSVRTLALSFGLVRSRTGKKREGFDHQKYWKRSIISAVAARRLARHVDSEWWEEAFLGGLLQDIGMLAMNAALGARYDKLCLEAGGDHLSLRELEVEAFGGDHSHAAVWLGSNWNLPLVLQESMGRSHAESISAEEIENSNVRKVVQSVALSGWLADIWIVKDTGAATQRASERAASLMGLDRHALETVLASIADSIPETSELFELEVASAGEVAGILAEARDALVALSLQTVQRAISAERTVEQLQRQTAQLEDKFQRDPMTGLYNRHRMESALKGEYERASRLNSSLSIIFADFDRFKRINDTYGHQAGDAVLIAASQIIQGEVRNSDIVARFGGEEFVVIMPGVDSRGLRMVSERIRARIEEHPFALPDGQTLRCTISLGGATYSESNTYEDADALLNAADKCVYSAKRSGRNKVVVEGDPVTTLRVVPPLPDSEPAESLAQSPAESPTESLAESPTESLAESPTESLAESPTESLAESPTESLAESPTESLAESPTESPTESPAEEA
jgi:diguanylate cyclase (GGDEF)-like protein